MVIRTTTTKSTPTTKPTLSYKGGASSAKPMQKGGSSSAKPMQKGGSTAAKPMQKGGSSCAKPKQNGGSTAAKPKQNGGTKTHSHKKTKKVSKSKKKTPMPKGFAYCLMCGKQTEMLNPETRTTKNGRKQLVGEGKCGHKVYRFI